MSLLGILVLTTSLGVTRGPAGNTEDAFKALSKASYKQFGVDKHVKKLEKKYVPETIRKHGKWVAISVKIVTEKKISYEWKF